MDAKNKICDGVQSAEYVDTVVYTESHEVLSNSALNDNTSALIDDIAETVLAENDANEDTSYKTLSIYVMSALKALTTMEIDPDKPYRLLSKEVKEILKVERVFPTLEYFDASSGM